MWIKVDDAGASRVVRALRGKTDPAIADVREQIKKKLATPARSEVLDLAETRAVLVALEHLMTLEYVKAAKSAGAIASAIPKVRVRYDRLVEKASGETAKKTSDQSTDLA